MARAPAVILLLGWLSFAQAPSPRELVRGQPEPERIGALVEAGALPASELDRARAAEADREDEAILRQILYGSLAIEDLTEEQGRQMVAAAQRRLERRRVRLEQAKKLVEEGALPRLALTPLLEELDRARRTLDLAASRARLLNELAEMARAEAAVLAVPAARAETPSLVERFEGETGFHSGLLTLIATAFEMEFKRPLPISANGSTALHRAWGLDHRGRVDVALDPDSPEGKWLRRYLEQLRIPYYAFRAAVRGRSTGPHIHIGPPSEPLRAGGG